MLKFKIRVLEMLKEMKTKVTEKLERHRDEGWVVVYPNLQKGG
jgi:oligoendopeptidase F